MYVEASGRRAPQDGLAWKIWFIRLVLRDSGEWEPKRDGCDSWEGVEVPESSARRLLICSAKRLSLSWVAAEVASREGVTPLRIIWASSGWVGSLSDSLTCLKRNWSALRGS